MNNSQSLQTEARNDSQMNTPQTDPKVRAMILIFSGLVGLSIALGMTVGALRAVEIYKTISTQEEHCPPQVAGAPEERGFAPGTKVTKPAPAESTPVTSDKF